jgi:hypothetical protein
MCEGTYSNSLRRKTKSPDKGAFSWVLAEWTGLEPATPGVTGRYSNQLNYHSSFTAGRLQKRGSVVGANGFEPLTYAL